MNMLKNMKDVNALVEAISCCKDPVILRSADGLEEYNMKSGLSQLIGLSRLCEEHGEEYEVFCVNRADEGYILSFFFNLRQRNAASA